MTKSLIKNLPLSKYDNSEVLVYKKIGEGDIPPHI
jgi:hypothetical protein